MSTSRQIKLQKSPMSTEESQSFYQFLLGENDIHICPFKLIPSSYDNHPVRVNYIFLFCESTRYLYLLANMFDDSF